MTLKLYSHPLSLFSAKVRIALAEKQLAYELEDVPLHPARGYDPKHPEVVRHNPKQQVPVLVDGDFVLYDSTVIGEYLEDLAPDPALYPREPKQRARCRLLELEADELNFTPIRALIMLRYAVMSGRADDPAERERSARDFAAHSQRLAQHLGAAEFLCERFSVADIAHFLVVGYGLSFGLGLPSERPELQAWFSRIAARPSVATELAIMAAAAKKFGAAKNASAIAEAAQ